MADGQVVFEISADGKKAYASLNDFTRAVEQAGKKWDQSVSGSADNMQKSFTKAFDIERLKNFGLEIGKALLQFGKEAVGAASDLREVQNVVDVTFGENAGQINAWAKTAITQFGLTETKAKQFASTMGAMMKSSGLAGPEIVDMSEKLAGLAADMSSFYNMDFDTAFQKIRSGISGETEPLKQLGINMSVVNLEAFALQQGISKAFNEMSQGEQIMLRYQYLMQATADAQGDFARTADSLANSKRLFEANIQSIQTKLGEFLVGPLATATGFLNDFLGALTPTGNRTVLDDFADIDLQTEQKLQKIRETATEAGLLVDTLNSISNSVDNTAQSSGLISFIESLSGKVSGLDSALESAKNGQIEEAITNLAKALSAELGGDPAKWENMLRAIGDNAAGAIAATSGDSAKTKAFLENVAAGADDLTTDYSSYWESLLSVLGDNAGAVISAFANAMDVGGVLKDIAEGSNVLNDDSPDIWKSLLTALKQVDGLSSIFSNNNAAGNVEALAQALSGNAPDTTKAEAWQTFLGALQANAGALTALTGTSPEETAKWLQSIADAANKLTPENAEGWNKLLSNFVGGLPGLADTEGGKAFFDSIAQNFLAMGVESEQAKAGLASLGLNTDQIKEKQALWLEVCKRLVAALPGLSSIIDTQTGEVKGGTEAIKEYIQEWQGLLERDILLTAVQQKKDALAAEFADLPELAAKAAPAAVKLKEAKAALDEALSGRTYNPYGMAEDQAELERLFNEWQKAQNEYLTAYDPYKKRKSAYDEAIKLLNDEEEALKELGITAEETTDAVDEVPKALTDIELAATKSADGQGTALKRVETAIDNAKSAYKELADYIEKTRSGIDSTVSGMFGVFNKIETPMQKAINNTKNLTAELNKGIITQEEYNKKISGDADSYVTSSKIIEGLKSQIDYMEEYQRMLAEAKKNGLSDELASALSDGSMESFDTLKALTAKGANIEEINKLYAQVQKQKSGFVDALTQQKLKADEVFDAIVAKAREATAGLDQSGAAEAALANTVQGMVAGIAEKIPDLESKVRDIGEILATLEQYGMSFSGLNLGTIGGGSGINLNFSGGGNGSSNVSITGAEIGMDRVPFDGYLAALHEGESILTAEEARVWRNMKYGPRLAGNQFDYGAMGSAIGANMPNFNGMQVVWNGQVLGRVIAAQQADSLRTMERSGWRG